MAEASLVKKLGIRNGQHIAIINAPPGYLAKLEELPPGVSVSQSLEGNYHLVQAFFTQLEDLMAKLGDLKAALSDGGILWISYPKLSAKMESDLSRDILRVALGERALKSVALVSIDETWSAMRFKKLD